MQIAVCIIGVFSVLTGGQPDDKFHIVGLNFCLVGGFVSDRSTAPVTLVSDNEPALCVGVGSHRTEYAATGVGAVTGIYIHVYGA